MSVAAGVGDAAIPARDKLRGKIGLTRVKRYWRGKAPEWAASYHDIGIPTAKAGDLHKDEDGGLAVKDDRRLRRLAQCRAENMEELRADRHRIRQAEVVSTVEEAEEEEAQEERRRRIKERQRLREQEELLPQEEEEEEGEESEYDTDSEDEQMGVGMAKPSPLFIPKSRRDTIAERERLKEEERRLKEVAKKRAEARKVETRQIVVEEIRKEEEHSGKTPEEEGSHSSIEDVDTSDESNGAEEYESWRSREAARIKRGREGSDAGLEDKGEVIKKARSMAEAEDEERRSLKPIRQAKRKRKFMQRYYHKGAFFQDSAGEDGICSRDFSAPTGEDEMDRSILPKVMQVRHIGRSGRTKWTHLLNEDTTDRRCTAYAALF